MCKTNYYFVDGDQANEVVTFGRGVRSFESPHRKVMRPGISFTREVR